jgi:hypothetical protein
MHRRGFLLSGLTAALARAQRLEGLRTDPSLTAGFADRDITPELGSERPGNYGKGFHRAFFDPCKVRAAVFGEGDTRVAIVGLDALMIRRPVVQAARAEISRRRGIAPEAVMVGASHSHSSGPTGMVQPGEYDHASDLVKKLAYEHSSCAGAGYLQRVQSEIANAVCAADAAREPALAGFGKGREDQVIFNRRFRMKNGLSFTHPRQGNPEMVEPAGPIDPEVGVLAAWNRHGVLTGCIVNFACHGTAGPPGISANWIYWMERVIRGAYGQQAVVVFTAGANGDVTQVDNLSPHALLGGADSQRWVGGRVGAEAVKTMLPMQPGAFSPLAFRSKLLRIPRRKPSKEHLEQSLRLASQDPGPSPSTEWIFAKEIVMLDARLAREPVADVEVQAIQVGPAIFVSNPAEYFVEYGLRIKKESPFPFTWPVELANDCVGYVPTEEAFGPHGGGYETRLTSYSNLEPAAGTEMADAGIALAKSMKPGPAPEPPPPGPFTEPWSYGNLPPQVE